MPALPSLALLSLDIAVPKRKGDAVNYEKAKTQKAKTQKATYMELGKEERYNVLRDNCAGFVEVVFDGFVDCTYGATAPRFCKSRSLEVVVPTEEQAHKALALFSTGFPATSKIRKPGNLRSYIRGHELVEAHVLVKEMRDVQATPNPFGIMASHAAVGLVFMEDKERVGKGGELNTRTDQEEGEQEEE